MASVVVVCSNGGGVYLYFNSIFMFQPILFLVFQVKKYMI